MMFSSFFWKKEAREALKNHWLTALLIFLVVQLPSLLVQGVASVTGYDLMTRLQQAVYGAVNLNTGTMNSEEMVKATEEILGTRGIWIMQGLQAVAWLVTPCLVMGMYHWMQLRLQGEEGEVSVVFSRLRLFWKGMGLRLYTTWRVFLWMLPGVAVAVLSLVPVWTADASSSISLLSAMQTSSGLMSVSSIAMVVLGVLGALQYALADIRMAEKPELGVRASARESRELMKGQRGRLFMLYLSFVLWYMLEMFLVNLCLGMFGSIPALMVEMLCSLALNAYISMTVCSFCRSLLRLRDGVETPEMMEE